MGPLIFCWFENNDGLFLVDSMTFLSNALIYFVFSFHPFQNSCSISGELYQVHLHKSKSLQYERISFFFFLRLKSTLNFIFHR